MNIKTKRHLSAWLLLSVFLPMLVFSSLHVHDDAPSSSGCFECINHIPHHGHLSLDTIHLNDCLLCQFASLSFMVAVAVMLTVVSKGYAVIFIQPTDKPQCTACQPHSPRAPPVVI